MFTFNVGTHECEETCGDGFKIEQQCDDGHFLVPEILYAGDGCDTNCEIEVGWYCDGNDPDTCYEICGDGLDMG